jgi:hypothetical protein
MTSQRSGEYATAQQGRSLPRASLALPLVLGTAVRADRAIVETTESDTSMAQALATIGTARPC